ncbi:hypothetical protein C4K04_4924 [Pseudomonas chlororaphis]|uniref:Uncharacterized protein n=1 Tax=Pseudomonas chlororaphis TaxID=587753 RepID=A0A3G7TTY7_9PSED|nr:hypothetical protein C4K04_4924 [Pseudomonas chlororaphis]
MSARNRPSDVGHCGGLEADDKGCGARLSRGGRQLFFSPAAALPGQGFASSWLDSQPVHCVCRARPR